jgi:AraC-like DNA-binding protein
MLITQDRYAVSVPLQDHVLFTSTAFDEAQDAVGRVFCPHKLRPNSRTQSLNARMHHAKVTQRSSLNYLHYGSEVTVEPGPLGDFFNIQVQMAGRVETQCGKQVRSIAPGQAAVLSPGEFVSMQWMADSAMLIYCIEREFVEHKLRTLLETDLRQPIVFDIRMSSDSAAGAGWLRAISLFQQELDIIPGFLNYPHAIDSFEECLVLSLLYGQRHNYSELLLGQAKSVAPGHVKRVEDFIRAHAANHITIEDLASIANISARSMFSGFKRFRGTTPMKFLRDVRLTNARLDLQQALPGTTVTDVCGRWGFCQFGRFAAAYKAKFGELPSITLRAAMFRKGH